MKQSKSILRPALTSFLLLTLICGILYPGIITGIAGVFFPHQANGSVITVTMKDGTKKEYGSALIAQTFTETKYLIGRPSDHPNLSPVSEEYKKVVAERILWWHTFDPANTREIPADLIAASGSGVDPNISPEAAEFQVARIAKVRGVGEETVRAIIKKYTTGRLLFIWGEPAVNVLKVNLALDGLL
jgi:potassium-transporting ATPase KdpC subunit